ncbi:hypothetical protein O3P69_010373 [Scylla paramamosain]|uniref:Alpha-1,3-mannosyl-glycoprotein 2-beta-N-acetylglucosaminyltransferase n=1 Tax=Scylla paramamosain TaxID=85552 RepID=A0AAW0TSG4_SCYPA
MLQREGSAAAPSLLRRGMSWAWACVRGGKTIGEAVSVPIRQTAASGLLLHTLVHLITPDEEYCPAWPRGSHWDRRRLFCDTYEGYGDLCSCDAPRTLPSAAPPIENSQLQDAVVGFDERRVEVFTPEPHEELAGFLAVLGLPLTVTHQLSDFVATLISKQFVFAFRHMLAKYPRADLFIVLEEDIKVSPDFFVFLNRTAKLLKEDPSLHCVSAHNDLSYPGTSRDPRALLRAASYTNYGWMVTREFAQEMVAGMENQEFEFDWDTFTYFFLRRGRECIIPEVSRSHHFGDAGVHLSQFSIRLYFSAKNYNLDPEAWVEGAEELEQGRYEALVTSMLVRARVVEVDPCQRSFPARQSMKEGDVLVLFFHYAGNLDLYRGSREWQALASCLETFALEPREGHNGLYRLRHGAAHLLLVAHPASPYSKYKPENATVFSATPEVLREAFRRGEGRLQRAPFDTKTPQQHYAYFAAAQPTA